MPIVIIVFAAGGALGTWLLVRKLRKPVRIVLLGESQSGKTTLLLTWRGEWTPNPPRTMPLGDFVGKIEVKTGDKVLNIEKRFIFPKVTDFSGWDEGVKNAREEIKAARVILYLVTALRLREAENRPAGRLPSAAWQRIELDANRVSAYSEQADRIVLVVTYTDKDPRYEQLGPAAYLTHVEKQLSDFIERTRMNGRVKIVAGSLATEESAAVLAADVVQAMS